MYFDLFILFLLTRLALTEASQRASIKTEDGNLILEAAEGRDIYLKSGNESASIYLNVLPLVKQLQDKTKSDSNDVNNPSSINSINKRLDKIEEQLSLVNISVLDNSTASKSPRLPRARITQLSRRISSLELLFNQLINSDPCTLSPCKNGGQCINILNRYFCQCPKNWEGKNCDVDVNECHNFAGTELGCQNGATCINKQGSYECTCANGWFGLHCTRRANDCSSGDSEMCGHGSCMNTQTGVGYKCICDQGWTANGTGLACVVDIDECASGIHHCSKNPKVKCINIPGTYACGQCPQGYVGNGYECTDVDECLSNNGGCSTNPLVTCYNTVGSRICAPCPPGFQGDGTTCSWRGSCTIENGGCHPSAKCVENLAAGAQFVQCICPAGAEGDGVGMGGCHMATSNETTCATNPCGHGDCYNVANGITCICHRGYTGARCMQRNKENACKSNRCMNGATCVPDALRLRGYKCTCPPPYFGTFCDSKSSICGEIISRPQGNVTFPESESNYTGNLGCAFVIETTPGKVLNVTFTKFQFEYSHDCSYEFLQIHDGRSTASRLLGRFCGNELPLNGTIISTHNNLYFWFRADHSVHREGFSIKWDSITPQCGSEIEVTSHGTLSSPGSPGNYPPDRDCFWKLKAPPSKRIQLQFYNIDFEKHPNCSFDYLAIYDGETESEPLLKKYCNKTLPEPLVSTGSSILLHFHSDSLESGQGFQLTYSSHEGAPGCGGMYTDDVGEITSPSIVQKNFGSLTCDYIIRVKEGYTISLNVVEFQTSGAFLCRNRNLKIYDGPTLDSKLFGSYCTDRPPNHLESTGNTLLIQYRSGYRFPKGKTFKFTYVKVCKHHYHALEGIIASPGYPNISIDDVPCAYVITLPPKRAIKINMVEFNMSAMFLSGCPFSYLAVRDGSDENAPLIGSYCNKNKPPPVIISTHNHIYLKYQNKLNLGTHRFLLNYTSVSIDCGGIHTEPVGNVSIFSSNKKICSWIMSAPEDKVVQLTSIDLNGPRALSDECLNHYVTVTDLDEDPTNATRFCGYSKLPLVQSNTNKLKITLNITEEKANVYFAFSYQFVDAKKNCGGRSVNPTGVIHSPDWPNKYPNNRECIWTVTLPVGQQIKLKVNKFALEERYVGNSICDYSDILEIRNGLTATSPLIGIYCGTIPSVITSGTNSIYIRFKSDIIINGAGFEIEWEGVSAGCGSKLSGAEGEIMSPNYPRSLDNVECYWRITTSAGSKVTIFLKSLDFDGTCSKQYVQLFDGPTELSKSLGTYCESASPAKIIETNENSAFVKYHSLRQNLLKANTVARGFHIKFYTNCNMNLTGYSGVVESVNFPNNYPKKHNCSWVISVPRGNRIKLFFTHMFTHKLFHPRNVACDFDKIEIVDKLTTKRFCHEKEVEKPLLSEGNTLKIDFITSTSFSMFRWMSLSYRFRFEWSLQGCGGKLSSTSGTLELPKDRRSIDNDLECVWEITTDSGRYISLSVLDLSLNESPNCTNDRIQIFDGIDDKTEIARFCHNQEQAYKFHSSTNKMIVKLQSSYVLKNFRARYSTVYANCGGLLAGGEGVILSPNYPHNYNNSATCVWKIKMPKSHHVQLDFLEVDLDSTNGCNDSLTITSDGSEERVVICGQDRKNSTYISKTNTITLTFKADKSNSAKGFKIKYYKYYLWGQRSYREG